MYNEHSHDQAMLDPGTFMLQNHSSSHSPRLETNQTSSRYDPVNQASKDERIERSLFRYRRAQGN